MLPGFTRLWLHKTTSFRPNVKTLTDQCTLDWLLNLWNLAVKPGLVCDSEAELVLCAFARPKMPSEAENTAQQSAKSVRGCMHSNG